jgi:hypothetical protein
VLRVARRNGLTVGRRHARRECRLQLAAKNDDAPTSFVVRHRRAGTTIRPSSQLCFCPDTACPGPGVGQNDTFCIRTTKRDDDPSATVIGNGGLIREWPAASGNLGPSRSIPAPSIGERRLTTKDRSLSCPLAPSLGPYKACLTREAYLEFEMCQVGSLESLESACYSGRVGAARLGEPAGAF